MSSKNNRPSWVDPQNVDLTDIKVVIHLDEEEITQELYVVYGAHMAEYRKGYTGFSTYDEPLGEDPVAVKINVKNASNTGELSWVLYAEIIDVIGNPNLIGREVKFDSERDRISLFPISDTGLILARNRDNENFARPSRIERMRRRNQAASQKQSSGESTKEEHGGRRKTRRKRRKSRKKKRKTKRKSRKRKHKIKPKRKKKKRSENKK
mgnify:CR=1 FL=1